MKRIKENFKMHNFNSHFIRCFLAFWLPCLLLQATSAISIGAIFDQTSRPGKEATVAIEIAIQDLNINSNQTSVLYLQNSRNKPGQAAIAAKQLIDEQKVKAIFGGHTWEEASAIAEVISDGNHDIPLFLSLAATVPPLVADQWPFFVQAVPTESTQMKAVAAVLQSMGIRHVTLIYETLHLASSSASIISHLSQAFRQTGSEITHILPLTSGSSFLDDELDVLKKQKRKVFVIHTSLELGIRLFQTAKKMDMTGDGYLWIATNGITDLFHSINPTTITSLKGMVGVKSYFPENTPAFQDFRKQFRQKFRSDYPEEEQDEPGIFAVQGYNAVKLLETKSPENFRQWKPILATTVEIVNVIGKGYHSVYWTQGLGFSETVEDDINGATTYTHSIDKAGKALWPVQPWYAHRRGRNLAESSENRWRVGVPGRSLFSQFVKVDDTGAITGFVVSVFESMMREMNQSFDYIPFNGSYDKLIRLIPEENFDAIAGDVTILSSRLKYVDFTQPYTESGLEMIVPIRSRLSNRALLFLKPFTAGMWWIIAGITIYNGFIIWLIEKNHNEDLRGSVIDQIGIIIWLSFTTLFTLRGDKLHSNLSRMAAVVWLFVALIITQSYTASLASMLTAQRLEPTITSVEMLRNTNATVGYCNGSFVDEYLRVVLGFTEVKTISYKSTHQYAEALYSGKIAAIFLEVPAAKVFLAQYCRSFIRTGETFKVGGFGFAFPKRYKRLSDVNKALMNVSESGRLKELEEMHIISEKCVDEESAPDEEDSLSARSFWVLFLLTGGASTVALAIYIIIYIKGLKKDDEGNTSFLELMSAYIKGLQRQMRRSSSIVVSIESARHASHADHLTDDEIDDFQETHDDVFYEVRI